MVISIQNPSLPMLAQAVRSWEKLDIMQQGIGIPGLIENLKTLQTTCSNIKEDLHLEPDPFEFLHQSLREDRKK